MPTLSRRFFFLIFIISSYSLVSFGRWADINEAPYAYNFIKCHVEVKKDGTRVTTVESQIEILKDSARVEKGLARLNYNESSGSFKILVAKTINPEKTLIVSKKNIELKPLASAGQGFDTKSQATIAFPDVKVGSKLYLKYEERVQHPWVPGFFDFIDRIGWHEYVQSFEYSFNSEVPLYYEIHDPEKSIETLAKGNSVVFKSKAPIYRELKEEENALISGDSLTWIGVTKAKSWKDFPKNTIQKYETEINSYLPAKFENILKEAQTKNNNIDQINAVTSALVEKIRYVGDWRLIKGAFHPRSLSSISESGYGDCKDFTVSTGAILKKMGYEVHAAWVSRGENIFFAPLHLAVLSINHAIVYARKDGHEYWIDPTNINSFAQGVRKDIENRSAIVLFPEGAQELHTPALNLSQSEVHVSLQLDFSSKDSIKGQGEFNLKGRAAEPMAGAELSSDKKNLDYILIKWATNDPNLLSWKAGDYELKSRAVKDFGTSFEFKKAWNPILTSAGQGYSIPTPSYIHEFQNRRDQRVSSLNITSPFQAHHEYHIKGRKVRLVKDIECQGSSEWADYHRRLYKESNEAVLKDDFALKVKTISAAAMATKEYGDFQEKLLSCMQEAVMIFE
ncbi:MAG: DUF3857 domain-containing protein [Pseudobdellovibrionaceae bacterium]